MKATTNDDPLQVSIAIVQDRAKVLILWEMNNKKQEFTQFIKRIPSLTTEAIQKELMELIELGLVSRVVYVKKRSQHIEYALTNRGGMLLKCLRKMMDIGIEIMVDYGKVDTLIQYGYVEKLQKDSDNAF